jgi:hypothetical protein
MSNTKLDSISCWVCGEEVSLRNCKIDELGHAVREVCYVARMKFEAETKQQTSKPTFPR